MQWRQSFSQLAKNACLIFVSIFEKNTDTANHALRKDEMNSLIQFYHYL